MKPTRIFSVILFLVLASTLAAQEYYRVERVVDGDTIILEGIGSVQLIGVDIPETVHPTRPVERFGREASAFTKSMAEGKRIRLEYDQDRKDRYDRTLAYAYLEDGTFLNAEIVRQGYGHAYTQFPFKYMEEFRYLEREAKEAGRGLWADQPAPAPQASVTVFVTRTGKKYHRAGCRYLRSSQRAINLDDAIRAGYTPCSVCKPPSHRGEEHWEGDSS